MSITDLLAARRATSAEAVLQHIEAGTDLIVPLANGEPVGLLDAIEANAASLEEVRVHQMHALHDRPYLHGRFGDRLRHNAYFLSPVTRPRFQARQVDFVPNNFSEVYALMQLRARNPLVLASVSPPDRHGNFSLGTNADYVASFIGRAPMFVEVNASMPRTFGRNQVHVSQVLGYWETDYPLLEVPPVEPSGPDRAIGAMVAERIPDGATIQTGIGAIPNAILDQLRDHQHLGVHTELLSDGLIDLVEAGVLTGTRKLNNRTKLVGTFALGTGRLYDFLHENGGVELWPVRYVNDPRRLSQEANFCSINATLAVDLLGQCASETIGGRYFSGSGGQGDFARGAMYSPGGQGFIVLRSTARTTQGPVSRIVGQLPAGEVVTTLKNTVDKVVTEHGVAELRGRSVAERARALIAVADPSFRDALVADARRRGFI
jgi:acyl-CoA hydrolase